MMDMWTTSNTVRLSLFFAAAVVLMATGYSAYKGHADDRDVNALLAAYPKLQGSAMDSCATCHRGGEVPDTGKPGKMRRENHCDFCHVIHVQQKRAAKETLNAYGAQYFAAGRMTAAVKALANKDSDGDGFSNETEFLGGTNPGTPESNPSARMAPYRMYTAAEIRTMSPVVRETVFVNTTKSRSGDSYNEYLGNRVYEVLQAAGIADAADSVDFISLDGYEKTLTVDELKKEWPQGAPAMGFGESDLGSCGWVRYSAPGLAANRALPAASILFAFEENGKKLETAAFDPQTARITGAGPLRLIVPQSRISPPDLGQRADPSCLNKVAEPYRFHEEYDHNGGKCSSAVIAVRVNPLPRGTRDYAWETQREQLLAGEKIAVFGALKSPGAK
jgi:hypothetical protein